MCEVANLSDWNQFLHFIGFATFFVGLILGAGALAGVVRIKIGRME